MSWKCSVARFPKDPTGGSSTALPIDLPKSHRKPGNFSRDRQSAEIGQLIRNIASKGADASPPPVPPVLPHRSRTVGPRCAPAPPASLYIKDAGSSPVTRQQRQEVRGLVDDGGWCARVRHGLDSGGLPGSGRWNLRS